MEKNHIEGLLLPRKYRKDGGKSSLPLIKLVASKEKI